MSYYKVSTPGVDIAWLSTELCCMAARLKLLADDVKLFT